MTARQAGDTSPTLSATYDDQKNHVQQIVSVLRNDVENVKKLHDEQTLKNDDLGSVSKAASPEFWAEFDRDPLDHLEFWRIASRRSPPTRTCCFCATWAPIRRSSPSPSIA